MLRAGRPEKIYVLRSLIFIVIENNSFVMKLQYTKCKFYHSLINTIDINV